MFALRRSCAAVVLVLLAITLSAAPPAPPTKDQIAKLVKQLGDNDFDVREAASKKLWDVGEVAEEALKKAAKSDDAEVSRRAGEIVEKFKWGLYPDTPKRVAELIGMYQAADGGSKANVIPVLFELGTPGCKAVLKIARVENDAGVRESLMGKIFNNLPLAVPALMEDNGLAILEKLVEVGLDNQVRTGSAHYAAFWLLNGKIDERITHYKASEKTSLDPKRDAEILAYLYRARGNLPAALEAATRAGVEDLIDQLLTEAGDWKKLAERKAENAPDDGVGKLGFRASYYRLAGQKKELDETVAALKKLVDVPAADDIRPFHVAKALMLNGRIADALEILGKGENQLTCFEILCARNQFKEAFDLVNTARFATSKELPGLELAEARTLYLLGEKEKAAPIFAKYAGMIKESVDATWYESLIDAEVRSGLMDQAFEHAAKMLNVVRNGRWAPQLFGKLYPGKKQTAEQLWNMLVRMSEKEEPDVRMKRLRAFLNGKAAEKDVIAFLDAVEKDRGTTVPPPGGVDDGAILAIADVALAAKMEDRAIALLWKAGGTDALLRVGDLLAEKKQWAKAAEAYREAWQADRANPLPLWLAGWSLRHAGKEVEGKKLMEQAHWLPLGAPAVRHQFALELLKRKQTDASRLESETIQKVCDPGTYYVGEATRRLALAAMMRRDYAASVEGHEKAMLCVLLETINFVQKQAYVGVPGAVHKQRAAALLKAGKTKEALEEARVCLEIIPGHVDVSILLVPDLEKRGMKKEADELFEAGLNVHEKLCRDFPNSAYAHNSVAWLRACCRRDLDQALEHALKATKLAPTNAGHHDTLAEVYFQRGDKAKAVETQKKVIELDPKRVYFRKQLKRIEAGDPTVPRPPEEDDEEDDD